jgi:hypothetical protein
LPRFGKEQAGFTGLAGDDVAGLILAKQRGVVELFACGNAGTEHA